MFLTDDDSLKEFLGDKFGNQSEFSCNLKC